MTGRPAFARSWQMVHGNQLRDRCASGTASAVRPCDQVRCPQQLIGSGRHYLIADLADGTDAGKTGACHT